MENDQRLGDAAGGRCVACTDEKTQDLALYRLGRTALSRSALALVGEHPRVSRIVPHRRVRALLHSPFSGRVRRCRECGLAQLERMPSTRELTRFYHSIYWPARGMDIALDAYETSPRGLAQLAFIREVFPDFDPPSVLEIGAGAAAPSLLIRAQSRRRERVSLAVVEPAEFWRTYYERLSIDVLGATFPPVPVGRSFSHVHTSHWLEHSVIPRDALLEIDRVLAPGGTIFVEVPFADEEYWDLPISDFPHTLFFSPESLRGMFERHGFRTLACRRVGISLDVWSRNRKPSCADFARTNTHGLWIRALFAKG